MEIKGATGSRPQLNFCSLPVIRPVACAGKVSSVAGATLIDLNADWTDQQFNAGYYVEFDSGLMVDILNTHAASHSLTLVDDWSDTIVPDETYRIRKHSTLADLLGTDNRGGLLAGRNVTEADTVKLFQPHTQSSKTFFYANVTGHEGWYGADYLPANDFIIYPGQGIIIERVSEGDRKLFLHGVCKHGNARAPVWEGYNLVGTLRTKDSVRLADLHLYTGDPQTGFMAGLNSTSTDNLVVIGPDETSNTYFMSNFAGYEGWYDSSYKKADDVMVLPGSAFYIHRKAGRGLFYWTFVAD